MKLCVIIIISATLDDLQNFVTSDLVEERLRRMTWRKAHTDCNSTSWLTVC